VSHGHHRCGSLQFLVGTHRGVSQGHQRSGALQFLMGAHRDVSQGHHWSGSLQFLMGTRLSTWSSLPTTWDTVTLLSPHGIKTAHCFVLFARRLSRNPSYVWCAPQREPAGESRCSGRRDSGLGLPQHRVDLVVASSSAAPGYGCAMSGPSLLRPACLLSPLLRPRFLDTEAC